MTPEEPLTEYPNQNIILPILTPKIVNECPTHKRKNCVHTIITVLEDKDKDKDRDKVDTKCYAREKITNT